MKRLYHELEEEQKPEISRVPLANVVLEIKMCDFGSPKEFLVSIPCSFNGENKKYGSGALPGKKLDLGLLKRSLGCLSRLMKQFGF